MPHSDEGIVLRGGVVPELHAAVERREWGAMPSPWEAAAVGLAKNLGSRKSVVRAISVRMLSRSLMMKVT